MIDELTLMFLKELNFFFLEKILMVKLVIDWGNICKVAEDQLCFSLINNDFLVDLSPINFQRLSIF